MNEVWKDIKGFDGHYQISNMGRVRYSDTWITRPYPNGTIVSIRTRKAGYKQLINRDGYVTVALNMPGVKYTTSIAKLVAEYFCKDYQDGMDINHIDGDTTNNRADNLRCRWFENLPGEEWKPIKGFEGLYEVSNMGRVLSLERISIHGNMVGGISHIPVPKRLICPNLTKHGYFHIILYKESKRFEYTLHRIVALHFCDGYKRGLVVNHKNEIKTVQPGRRPADYAACNHRGDGPAAERIQTLHRGRRNGRSGLDTGHALRRRHVDEMVCDPFGKPHIRGIPVVCTHHSRGL